MSEEDSTRAKDAGVSAVPAGARLPVAHEKCPHCGTIAVIEPSSTLRMVCGVCGKARVPIDDPKVVRTFAEKDALVRASTARNAAVAWTGASVAAGSFGVVSLLFLVIAAAAASPGVALVLLAALAASVPLLFAAWGMRSAAAHRKAVGPAVDEAWALAARDVVAGRSRIVPKDLAQVMRLPEAEAERLLIVLSTDGVVRSRVLDAGELEFEPSTPVARTEAEVQAEAEAEADAEAASAKRSR